jgi:hypothetical protein
MAQRRQARLGPMRPRSDAGGAAKVGGAGGGPAAVPHLTLFPPSDERRPRFFTTNRRQRARFICGGADGGPPSLVVLLLPLGARQVPRSTRQRAGATTSRSPPAEPPAQGRRSWRRGTEAPAAACKGPAEGARQLGAATSGPWWTLAEPLDSAGFGGRVPTGKSRERCCPPAAHIPRKFYDIRMVGGS